MSQQPPLPGTRDKATEEFARFAELFPEALLLVSSDGTVLAANRGVARRLGLAPPSLCGRRLPDVTTGPPECLTDYLRACARSPEMLPGALELRTPDGGRRACRVEGRLFRPRSDTAPALVLLRLAPRESTSTQFLVLNQKVEELSREVAHRRQVEQSLAEQKEWLRTTLASIGDAVIAVDTEGRITFLNSVAEALTGWGQDEAAGQPLARVFPIRHELSRQPAENPVERVLREGRVVGLANHTVLVARDGTETPIEDSAAPIRDAAGRITGVVLVFHDVTERRHAERETQRLNRELQRRVAEIETLLTVVPICIAVAEGPDCRRIWSNPAFARLVHARPEDNFSFSAPEAERPTTFRVVHNGREVPPDELPLQVATATGREVHGVEQQLLLADGSTVHLLCSAAPLFDEAGRVRGGVFVGVDITERKKHEALLEGQKRVLERMVQGAPLVEVLEELCRIIEAQAGGRRIATVLLRDEDGAHLRPVAGRRAPEGWTQAIDPLPIGPRVGSCGTAAYRAEPVIVADIATDPLWADFRDLALGYGLRACWSTPILSSQGRVLGTFAVYHNAPHQPGPDELRLVDLLARTAGVAIERRRAEAAVRESEEQFRTLADSIPQLCWMTRPDGHIFWYNRRWYEYTGTTPEQMEGWGWQVVHDPAELPRVLERWKAALASEQPWEDTFPLRRHDGQMRWHLSRAVPVRDERGRVVRWFGTNTDIEDRREAEARLARYAARQRLLWEAAAVLLTTDEPDAMLRGLFAQIAPHFGLDCYFNFVLADTGDALKLASWAGISEEEARAISRLEFGQAICGLVALERRPRAVTSIQQSADPRVQIVKGYGIRAYACNPLLVGDRLLGTLSFASRTRDHFDEEELEFLRTVCHYATVAYERLRLVHELREADRRKDEFLATLAHELRNPLAPIRNSLQLLRLAGHNPALQDQAWGMMDRQLTQMVRLIDDLLDVSRISRGKLELRKEWVELAAVVQSAVETARPVIEAGAHTLAVTLPPEPMALHADPTRLAQVIANLLNNAAKYTNRGGRIELTAERHGAEAAVRVRDTGIGIPPDQLPRIFEMFVQVDRSLERAQGGLGIGLTLVKRLVEMHGGRVEAHSAGPGTGSEFVVRLPLARPSERPGATTPGDGAVAPSSPRRVLVVDDNRDGAESLAMMLRVMGHEVRIAHDGLAGVEAAAVFRPDVVLLDLGMPRLNGYDAARRLRAEPWGQAMLLVALTGWGQEADRRRTREAGFDEHLVKPVGPTALEKVLVRRKVT